MTHNSANSLVHETSPYLLQHAYNPVHWEAWSPEALEQASKENKLLIISIGYAACHWCHVMEKECFEDEEVAVVMNDYFVNIKVDREERPDIDHIYMDALQIMTGSGGWPLNIVALPDGRPFWGATYVKKERWISILEQLQELYNTNPSKVLEYAENLTEGIKAINLVNSKEDMPLISQSGLAEMLGEWTRYFDKSYGGYQRAPKFMMPTHLSFFLHYGTSNQDEEILEHVYRTLDKMADGGLYDHLGGGFSRYSVDEKWHVPHFEKMLYDNGQLVSLYAKAYAISGKERYKEVVEETIAFVSAELMSDEHGFYSSLDADSENKVGKLEEGSYYVWEKDELEALLGEDFELFKDYYNINTYGLWEDGKYVLIRDTSEEKIASKYQLDIKTLKEKIQDAKNRLNTLRNKRSRPRLDDKILTSWNGLMLLGLVDAHRYLGNKQYLDLALKNAAFLKNNVLTENGLIFHNYKDGKRTIAGYLEDYATLSNAFLQLYEATSNESWLYQSKVLVDYCVEKFYDAKSELFFFTSETEEYVIRRTLETLDNVIPSSNSIMAEVLFKMDKLFQDEGYGEISKKMLHRIQPNFSDNLQGYSNWLRLALLYQEAFYEVAVVGDDYEEKLKTLLSNYLPNAIFCGVKEEGTLGLLKHRHVEGKTLIYICQQGSCKYPVSDPLAVVEQLGYALKE